MKIKNKDRYLLTDLEFHKKRNNDYRLSYVTEVYLRKEKIAVIEGSAMSDILSWLEGEENEKEIKL